MQEKKINVNMSVSSIEKQRKEVEVTKSTNEKKRVEFDVKNYLNLKLKKDETSKKVRIRILNITPDATTPFLVLKTHSLKVDKQISESGYKTFVCLEDENLKEKQKCPLCSKSEELFKLANECKDPIEKKSLIKSAYSYRSKITYILRVIDRDHEDEGVKFWRFNAHADGTGCYDMLMSIYDERMKEHVEANLGEYNIFDLNNGKDIIITITSVPNTNKTSISIVDAGIETPLSKDYDTAMKWINDEKVWSDLYSIKNSEYLQIIADGKVPVKDKTTGKYISSDEFENNNNNIEKNANDILKNNQENNENLTSNPYYGKNEEFQDEDLPF